MSDSTNRTHGYQREGHGAGQAQRLIASAWAVALAGILLTLLLAALVQPGVASGAAQRQGAALQASPPSAPLALGWLSQDASATTGAAWGDVDGDGDLDLAVSNANGPNRLYINVGGELRSDAPGAWTSAENDASNALAWGDVDGDGDLDLVVANGVRCQTVTTALGVRTNCTPGQERLYRNDAGQLTRQAVWSSTLSDDSRGLALGDVDGDGDLDLAVANVRPERGCTPAGPCLLAADRIYRNDRGVFRREPAWTSTETDDTIALAWGNLDTDRELELVTGGQAGLKLYDNTVAGLATTATPLAAAAGTITGLALGDIDRNGALDLAAAGGQDSRTIWVLSRPAGEAAWQPAGVLTATQSILTLALGDYDADGYPDLALGANCAYTRSQCRLQFYHNNQGQIAPQPLWQSDDNLNAAGLAWGDADGDGDLDLAVGAGNAANQPNRLYLNTSQPLAVQQALPQRGDGNPVSAAWADADGDGDLDLALGFSNQCSLSTTACTPGRPWLYVNEDGVLTRQPIVTANAGSVGDRPEQGEGSVGDRPEQGEGSVGDRPEQGWGDVSALAWGDYDRDGDPDLAAGSAAVCAIQGGVTECRWVGLGGRGFARARSCRLVGGEPACSNGGVRLFRNDQGVLTETPVWQGMADETVASLAWGDVDGDGYPDLAAGAAESCGRDVEGNLICRDGWSRVLPNVRVAVSDTLDTAPRTLSDSDVWRLPAAQDTSALAWGDVDNDGDPDLMMADRRQRLRLYQNEGGQLAAEPAWESEQTAETRSLAWGDVDGDGDLDLAVANQDEALHVYRNDGGRLASTIDWTARETNRNPSLAWGDIDGDGDLDLAVNGEEAAYIYLNANGALEFGAAWSSAQRGSGAVAWGDADADGLPDLLAGGTLFRNLQGERLAAAGAPRLVLQTPHSSSASTSLALASPHTDVSVTYTLSNGAPGQLADVRGFYSLNGPGHWQPATPLTGTQTTSLASGQHVFVWDAARDGLMGRSDGVVLRLTAAASSQTQRHAAAERQRFGAVSAATEPFPVRGTQVRVMDKASRQP
ncbi:MAG TPA: VCBS repeat-containing protein, partial [Anaerolineae bacterium]|nr:VCBS repeat-containing protein [Anaerolineae bacterium]